VTPPLWSWAPSRLAGTSRESNTSLRLSHPKSRRPSCSRASPRTSRPTCAKRTVSRDHAERLLQALDVPVAMAGAIVHLDVRGWTAELPAFSEQVPGDFSACALLVAAASVVPASRVCVRATGLNPTRTGLLDVLRVMGGAPEVEIHRSAPRRTGRGSLPDLCAAARSADGRRDAFTSRGRAASARRSGSARPLG